MFNKAFKYGEANKPSQKEIERRRFLNKQWSEANYSTATNKGTEIFMRPRPKQ